MPFIDIYTNNQSRALRNASTFIDNWVYVPGVAITGDPYKVYAFTTLDDFKNACGTHGPKGSRTFEYVSGLLNAGLPVLFRRIAYENQDGLEVDGNGNPTVLPTEGNGNVKRASLPMYIDEDHPNGLFKVYEKYGGTFGNDMYIYIRKTLSAYYMDVYLKTTVLERLKVCAYYANETLTDLYARVIDGLKNINETSDRISIEIFENDPSKFTFTTTDNKLQLSGGEDFNTSTKNINKEIANSYAFIQDKILYQPKFLTSGGYYNSIEELEQAGTTGSSIYLIGDAMKDLSLKRQDCRAIIDLPLNTPPEDQQTYARMFAYTQDSESQLIPSAMICAPWQYMRIGSSQEWMPPSYAYLVTVGRAVSAGSQVYTPKAGIATGQVANIIRPQFEIGSDLAAEWQSEEDVNINPIMRLQGGSYVIAGNSTLLMPDSASGTNDVFCESSGDLTVIEIRRFVYNLATELQYQYNSVAAFETFSIRTAKFMEKLSSEGAITDYEIINASSDAEPRKLKVILNVFITPTIKQIEIYLNIQYGSIEVSTGGVA